MQGERRNRALGRTTQGYCLLPMCFRGCPLCEMVQSSMFLILELQQNALVAHEYMHGAAPKRRLICCRA